MLKRFIRAILRPISCLGLIVFSLILACLIVTQVLADDEPPAVVRNNVDQFDSDMSAMQITYTTTYGRYLQLRSIPPNTQPSPEYCPDDVPVCPTFSLPAAHETSLEVNVYTSPYGVGYEIVAVYEQIGTGTLWRRVYNHGPEAWRERDWYEYDDEVIE